MRAWLLLATLLLSGCSGGSGGGGGTDGEAADPGAIQQVCVDSQLQPTGQEPVDGVCPPPPPVLHVVPVDFDGNLGVSAIACESTVGQCVPPEGATVVQGETDFLYEHPGATLVAVNLTLTWEAASAATDTLAMGAMRMGDNSTEFAHADGMSPLELQAEGLDILLDADNLFHAYVYNAKGPVHQATAGAYTTADQEFHIEGTLTFALPQAATAQPGAPT